MWHVCKDSRVGVLWRWDECIYSVVIHVHTPQRVPQNKCVARHRISKMRCLKIWLYAGIWRLKTVPQSLWIPSLSVVCVETLFDRSVDVGFFSPLFAMCEHFRFLASNVNDCDERPVWLYVEGLGLSLKQNPRSYHSLSIAIRLLDFFDLFYRGPSHYDEALMVCKLRNSLFVQIPSQFVFSTSLVVHVCRLVSWPLGSHWSTESLEFPQRSLFSGRDKGHYWIILKRMTIWSCELGAAVSKMLPSFSRSPRKLP